MQISKAVHLLVACRKSDCGSRKHVKEFNVWSISLSANCIGINMAYGQDKPKTKNSFTVADWFFEPARLFKHAYGSATFSVGLMYNSEWVGLKFNVVHINFWNTIPTRHDVGKIVCEKCCSYQGYALAFVVEVFSQLSESRTAAANRSESTWYQTIT